MSDGQTLSHAFKLLDQANRVLAERAADHWVRIGAMPEADRADYVKGYDGNDAAVASTAVLLALLGGSSAAEHEDVKQFKPLAPTKPFYFDRAPTEAITAVRVRALDDERVRNCDHDRIGPCFRCVVALWRVVFEGLQKHPGVSSSARAVIEAALE